MKTWYIATYKKTDGTYGTALVLSDNEAKAEEHFSKTMIWHLSVSLWRTRFTTIAAKAVRLWSFEQQNKKTKAGVSDLEFTADAPAIFTL